MSGQPDHELEVLETDQTVPPRPEEEAAEDARAAEEPSGLRPSNGE
jgi:hypothetical protein